MNRLVNPTAGIEFTLIFIIGISLVLLFAITATMIGFVIRYRRQRHPVPADIRGHTGLELVWMILPTIIALAMFYVGWSTYTDLRTVPPNALVVEVTGEMFAWSFTYPNGKTSSEMVVPLGRPVKVNLNSRDVIHSFFVPAYRIKMDVVKGLKTYAWFQPDHLGTFNILCAEYCGQGHSEMNADLKVVAPEAFEAWLAKPETPAAAATATGPGPETRKLFDFSTFFRLQDKMTFRWKVDGPLLHCALQAPAEGWVAVGFNPSHGGMDGAKFVIAYVKDGKVYAQDHVGVSPVRHEAVEQHGGTSDVTNVFGALSNGVTEVCFSIPLQGTDGQQKVLDPSGSTILLLAYNAGMADFRTKHNYRKAFRVKLATGESSPLEAQRP